MSNLPEIKETHIEGILSVEKNIQSTTKIVDFGIQIAEDGRIWICVDGAALIRFKPTTKFKAILSKINQGD